jgi:hypothetical protein
MVKTILNISINRDVAISIENQREKENEARKLKMKEPINKSEFLQSLMVIGLIVRTNKREDIPRILQDYFEDETK